MKLKPEHIIAGTVSAAIICVVLFMYFSGIKSESKQDFLWSHWLMADGEHEDLCMRYTHDTVYMREDGSKSSRKRVVEWFVPQVDTVFIDSAGKRIVSRGANHLINMEVNYYRIKTQFILYHKDEPFTDRAPNNFFPRR